MTITPKPVAPEKHESSVANEATDDIEKRLSNESNAKATPEGGKGENDVGSSLFDYTASTSSKQSQKALADAAM